MRQKHTLTRLIVDSELLHTVSRSPQGSCADCRQLQPGKLRAVAVFAATLSGEERPGERAGRSAQPQPPALPLAGPADWRGGQVSLLRPERLAGAKTAREGGREGGSGEREGAEKWQL